MKKNSLLLGTLLLVPKLLLAQTANYIKTSTHLDASGISRAISTDYCNGTGKKIASVSSTPEGNYVHAHAVYDNEGRLYEKWQPVGVSTDGYQSTSTVSASAKSFYSDPSPYTRYEYDALGRVIGQTGPGDTWYKMGKKIKKSYISNSVNSVICYEAPTENNSLVENGCYKAASLFCEETTDEDGHTLQVFTDFQGEKVLERRDGNNDTYYVYNDYGELRFVLPPGYQDGGMVDSDAYEYRYDDRGRMVYKKVPGCDYVSYAYDKGDRLAKIQDGVLRSKGLWRFMLYDDVSRLCLQGTCISFDLGNHSATVSFSASQSGLCNTGYMLLESSALSNATFETVNYYDNYGFLSSFLLKGCNNISQLSKSSPVSAIGLLTGSVSKATDGGNLYEVLFYDKFGQVVDARRSYPSGHFLATTTSYTFTKKPSTITSSVQYKGTTNSSTLSYLYDKHADQLQSVTLSSGGKSQTVAQYGYDTVGRNTSKSRPSSVGTESYAYNVRNWLTEISSRLFTENLYYVDGTSTPCYKGNIARQQWKTGNEAVLRGYDFKYDGLNRLISATYGEGASLSDNKNRYDESIGKYTANGAIMSLQRNGKTNSGSFGLIDNLTYTLDGNRPIKISDSATALAYSGSFDFKDNANQDKEYTFDANGSMSKDANKGLIITYDNNSMPKLMDFGKGKKISYNFSALGEKLQVKHVLSGTTSTTDYIGSYIFKNGSLDKLLFDGGYCTFSGNTPQFHYYNLDHLGNVRVVANESGALEQAIHYYPFGGIFGDADYQESLQAYKYNGKELDRMHGLDWYDYGARMYDAAIGYWNGVDAMSDKNISIGQYTYCHDNPINKFDLDGNDDYFSKYGTFLYSQGNGANIFIQQGKSFALFQRFNLCSWNNLKVAARIVGHYARIAGVKYSQNGGVGNVGISTLHHTDSQGIILAKTVGQDILIKMKNGKLNETMYNIFNLENTIWHENKHKTDRRDLTPKIHMNIICNQILQETFQKGSSEYQSGTIGYLVQKMNLVQKSEEYETYKVMRIVNKAIRSLGFKIVRKRGVYEYEIIQ